MNSKITLGSVRKASGWSMVWGILIFTVEFWPLACLWRPPLELSLCLPG